MIVTSTRFGDIEISQQQVYQFIEPLFGFPELREFVLVSQESGDVFEYLQAVGEPDLTFIVIDPFGLFPDYSFDLKDVWKERLAIDSTEDIEVKVILTVRSQSDITANLKAPLIFNTRTKQAVQLVLDPPLYSIQHSLLGGEK
ncbi:flagellar assembly protein FliW [Paenibacillus sp.]|jgi:flagellar assembly factor FliW|uniref:flagellar assembly protein FliW n=1 Tax=Paenibacillus sp. TaxID=58172 RepID=UPI00281920F0|nr:flagellar assembly protein FliW [Paenibacillus sp.]MDR0268714.1 flagellar assembly protein FliW [Paenibacillus sp.]